MFCARRRNPNRSIRTRAADGSIIRYVAIVLCGAFVMTVWSSERIAKGEPAPLTTPSSGLEAIRFTEDLPAQRRHLWTVLGALARSSRGDGPFFEGWYGEGDVFADAGRPHAHAGLRGFARDGEEAGVRAASDAQVADAALITYTFYNDAAYNHIRINQLNAASELERLRTSGARNASGSPTVAPFSADSIVVKTAWWPIASRGVTALPVWDPELNAPLRQGNDYLSWQRIVAVDPAGDGRRGTAATIGFAGRSFENVHRVRLNDFYHVRVDEALAASLARDRSAAKAAIIALGRPIEAGDFLALVAVNIATKEISDWIWGAVWWHDHANRGPYASDRPEGLNPEWRHYLIDVAFDPVTPRTSDGKPRVCFNPWLEGRFPDGGHGGGTVSNCMACHQRASFPPASFLPVTRGSPDYARDQAYSSHRLRTSSLWSIAMHARPRPDDARSGAP